jgi:ATP phosphoribosyltransferase
MSERLVLGVPSKGRLMESTLETFEQAGLSIRRNGSERGYAGTLEAVENVDVAFLSASEIAFYLKNGRVHLGVTGEDLVRENISNLEGRAAILRPLGFGHANVVVAVPACWIDVNAMADIERIAADFNRVHGRHLRVATKYMNLTRRFFAQRGVWRYRIVESLGATEGTPAAGTAEIVVDISSSGATLAANHLKVLTDGLILASQACLVASKAAAWGSRANEARNEIVGKLGAR